MASKKKDEVQKSFAGLLVELILCAFCMLIGFLMIFVDSMKIEYFAYVIGGVLLALGIYLILNFFVRQGYKEITNYDFSGGVLVTAIGVIVLINAKSFDLSFYLVLGVMLLVLSVMIMQGTIQLLGMHGKAWWLNLIFGLLILAYAILLLTLIKTKFLENETLYYSLTVASGALGIFSIIITAIRSAYFKKEEAEKSEKRADHEDYSVPEIQEKNIDDRPEISDKNLRNEDIEADFEEISVPNEEIINDKKKSKKASIFKKKENTVQSSAEIPSEKLNTDVVNNISNSDSESSVAENVVSYEVNAFDTNAAVSTNENDHELDAGSVSTVENASNIDADDSGFDEDELNLLRKN